jgi:hypothetical protein
MQTGENACQAGSNPANFPEGELGLNTSLSATWAFLGQVPDRPRQADLAELTESLLTSEACTPDFVEEIFLRTESS